MTTSRLENRFGSYCDLNATPFRYRMEQGYAEQRIRPSLVPAFHRSDDVARQRLMLQFVHAAFRPIATMLAASDGRATSKFANMIANAPLAESGGSDNSGGLPRSRREQS